VPVRGQPITGVRMGKRNRGNPLWGGKATTLPKAAAITEFERMVAHLGLHTEREMVASETLRMWLRKYKNTRYVPESVLRACGMEAEITSYSL